MYVRPLIDKGSYLQLSIRSADKRRLLTKWGLRTPENLKNRKKLFRFSKGPSTMVF